MKLREIEDILCYHRGVSAKRMEAIKTQMLAAGLLTRGGRGLHAPEITERDVAVFMLAVGAAETVREAADVAKVLAALENRSGQSLVDVLGTIIVNEGEAQTVRNVRLMPAARAADILFYTEQGGLSVEYFAMREIWAAGTASSQGQGYVGPIGHIGGRMLSLVASEFAASTEEGDLAGYRA